MNLLETLLKFFNIPNTGNTPENKGQCTGLVNKYVESLGLPHLWGNAKDLMEGADTNAYAITPNDPNDTKQFPQPGSIMVWDGTWGDGDGHTGVVIFADGIKFSTLEQNNPDGHPPQTLMHDYKGVKGWITPKNLPSVPTQSMLDACMTDRDNLWKQRDDALRQVDDIKKQLDEANQKLTSFAASGYATIDDVNKKMDDKDKAYHGVSIHLQQVLDDNKTLATLYAKKEEQDSTAIDEGRNAQLKVIELERTINMIAMGAKTKPSAPDILSKFDTLNKWKQWGENILKQRQLTENKAQTTITEQKKSSSFLSEFFSILFGGGENI